MVDEIGFWLVVGIVVTGVHYGADPGGCRSSSSGQWTEGLGDTALPWHTSLHVRLGQHSDRRRPSTQGGQSPAQRSCFCWPDPLQTPRRWFLSPGSSARDFWCSFWPAWLRRLWLWGGYSTISWSGHRSRSLPRLVNPESHVVDIVGIVSAIVLTGLLVAGIRRGSWTSAIREVKGDLSSWRQLLGRASGESSPAKRQKEPR